VQKGFLSVAELSRLSSLGKPMVWHLQDMWAFTGGCHYAGTCTGFTRACGHCPYLKKSGDRDLSAAILAGKVRLLTDSSFQISTSSKWLQQEAQKSTLFKSRDVLHLPMGVNTDRYIPGDAIAARKRLGLPAEGLVFLFVAMNANDPRKGLHELSRALIDLANQITPAQKETITLAVLGKFDAEHQDSLPFRVHPLGYRRELRDILDAYQSADLFILPSLEDNLPNTVLEAMSCETPVVGFHSGGVPEMIDDGINGLLVPSGDALALCRALHQFILLPDQERILWGQKARQSMVDQYSYPAVSAKHIDHYKRVLGWSI
jgi:glycosyltransferase involved in cell wall biosynthesis